MFDCSISVLADDLTGAADSAVAFASRGIPSCVIWNSHEIARVRNVPVLAIDTETRRLGPSQAANRNVKLLEQCGDRGPLIFKKIDSTLRGEPAAEIAGIWDYLNRRSGGVLGIFAPASPQTGTTTRDGYVYRHGRPLDSQPSWKAGHIYETANLIEVLATANVNTTRVPLEIVRHGFEALNATLADISEKGDSIAICDAVEQTDLDQIAKASLMVRNCVFFIGSAGLAKALAARVSNQVLASGVTCPTRPNRGALIVVGSAARESQGAALCLARKSGLRDFPISPATHGELQDALLDELVGGVIEGLRLGDDILVRTEVCNEGSILNPEMVSTLAAALAPAACHASAIVATGGETAFAFLNQIGAREMRLIREFEPGTVLGVAVGSVKIPVVTKAGGFGGEDTLSNIVDHLRLIRNRGSL